MKLINQRLSNNNNGIQLYTAESRYYENGKTILFIGVFHGDEPEGEFLIENLMNEIDNNPDFTGRNQILCLPCLNPDGKELKTRGNANGVDLNRNFPTKNWELSAQKNEYYSGDYAGSEIETRFLIEILDEHKPDIIVTLHTPYRIINYDGPAEKLAHKISEFNNYPVQQDIGYPTPGSFGTYAGIERNIPVITLELPDNTSIEQLWADNKDAFIYISGSTSF